MAPHLQGMGIDEHIPDLANCLVHSYGDKDGEITHDEFEAEFGTHMMDCMGQVVGFGGDGSHDMPECGNDEILCFGKDGTVLA